jgi:glycosyltransferase involved in cell wall biosynthesis
VRLHFFIPGDPATRTGGYGYDRRVVEGLRARGRDVAVHRLADRFPRPNAADLVHATARLASLPDHALVLIDGLAAGAMPEVLARAAARLRIAALVHHPLALETGSDAHEAVRLRDSERAALEHARCIIANSDATARTLIAEYGVPAARLAVVPPGTDPAPLAQGARDGVPTLLCVGAVVPRKGHDVLLDALAGLADRAWRLVCVGSLERDRTWAEGLVHRSGTGALTGRVAFTGELDDEALATRYAAADAFVLATHHEGYGMAFAEALARGLPVIGTRAGAVPETVPHDAGLLVAPGNATALREALRRLLDDAGLRAALAAGAQRARLALPTWDDAARRLDAALFA